MIKDIVTAHWNSAKDRRHGGFTSEEHKYILRYFKTPSIHLFSGSSLIGDIRVDLSEESEATHQEEVLTYLSGCEDESFNMVIADPPYNLKNEKKYKTSSFVAGANAKQTSILKKEMIRVLKSNGLLCFKHWFDIAPGKSWIPILKLVTSYGGFRRITILTIYQKPLSILDFLCD